MKPLKKHERDQFIVGYCSLGMRPDGRKPKRSYATKSAAKRGMKATRSSAAQTGRSAPRKVYLWSCGAWHTSSR